MSIKAFSVLSEFRFDVGQAVIASDTLQGKVDQLSSSVDEAMLSVQRLGMGFVAQFSGAGGGILGLMGAAISASDKFTDSQISFTQIIDSNMAHLTGSIGSLNEKMAASKNIMKDIAKDALDFGIPAAQLVEMTKTLSAMLVPKGLAGENFGNARTMSRNLLKSAPNLGIDPTEVQGQLLRSIEGSASMGDTLFRRLLTEAPEPFKESKVTDAKGFNALDATKRFNILNDALGKFASNADLLAMRANTLSGIMQRARDTFSGFNSVLKPLGDVILPVLVELLNVALDWINTKGRELVKIFSGFIKSMIDSPKEMLINLSQLSALAGDVATSVGVVGLIVTLGHLYDSMHLISSLGPVGQKVAGMMNSVFEFMFNLPMVGNAIKSMVNIFKIGEVTSLTGLIKVLGITVLKMAGLFAVFLIPLQGLSRAIARVKIEFFEWLAENAVTIANVMNKLQEALRILFMPIMDMIKGFEELFFIILGGTATMDGSLSAMKTMVNGLRFLAEGFLQAYAALRAFIAFFVGAWSQMFVNIAQMIQNLMAGNFSDILFGTENIFKEGFMNAAEEFNKVVGRARNPMIEGEVDNARVSNTTINQDIKMTNNFKEVLQPDRIAFTIKDQLEKSSRNKTSATLSGTAALLNGAI